MKIKMKKDKRTPAQIKAILATPISEEQLAVIRAMPTKTPPKETPAKTPQEIGAEDAKRLRAHGSVQWRGKAK
jgi:hypothetical protein